MAKPIPLAPLMDRCFSLQRDSNQAVIHLDLSLIEQEVAKRIELGDGLLGGGKAGDSGGKPTLPGGLKLPF